MGREIKFRGRAFSEQGSSCPEKWVYGNLVVADNSDTFIIQWKREAGIGYMTIIWQVKPEMIGEYTGLKDRNGKEIYEGDVLYTNGNLSEEFDQYVGIVRFDEEVAGFVCDNMPFIPNQDCIVQGNIYENPELFGTTE